MLSFLKKNKPINPHDTVPDRHTYRMFTTGEMEVFHPWLIDQDIVRAYDEVHSRGLISLVSPEKFGAIKWAYRQTKNIPGEIWEAGVYKGGVANFFKNLVLTEAGNKPTIRLFDSFEGLPQETAGIDLHHRGDFADTSLQAVKDLIGEHSFIDYRSGWIPVTFTGLEESRLRLAHIDVDLYQPVLDCLEFIYPRTSKGGIIILDDYGLISCPGARKAADQFFAEKCESLFVQPSGQAIIIKI